MLKYRALSHLENSSAYKVQERGTNKQYILRRIEVGDQSIADTANKQFNDVITNCIGNTRVAKYMECFVNFSKLESALYLCLIGELFPMGSLKCLLSERKESIISIGEVMKWYGQLLEGIEELHRGNIIHRRVRSSNVFVRDTGLVLGYVGLQIEEGDIKREFKSILPPNYHNAPKNVSRELTSNFDIWCLGILLLEICTNSFDGFTQLESQLCGNSDEQIALGIQKLMDSIENIYSKELVNIISQCLQLSSADRCSIAHLCSLTFTQDCLSLISSPLLNCIRSDEICNLPNTPNVPYAIHSVIQYMRDNYTIRQCQLMGIEMLLICVNDNREVLNNSDKRLIRSVIEEYSGIILFELAFVKLLVSSLRYSQDDPMEVLLTQSYIHIVATIAMKQTDPTELFGICCVYLLMISFHDNNSTLIASYGIIPHVLQVVSLSHTDTNHICITHACSLLWGLAVSPVNLRALTELNTLEWTIEIIQHFQDNPTVLNPSFNLLWSLLQDNINRDKAYYLDIVNVCIRVVNKYSLLHELCSVVLSVVVVVCEIESCAFQLLADESSGLLDLLEFMKNGFPHLQIVMKTIELLNVQFKYKDLKEEILSLDLREILQNWFEKTQFKILNDFIEKL